MSLKVDLYPAHSPDRAQNRRRDIGPNRIIEIYDYPMMKPSAHTPSPNLAGATHRQNMQQATKRSKARCEEVFLPSHTEQPQSAQIHPGPVTKKQRAGRRSRACPSGHRPPLTTLLSVTPSAPPAVTAPGRLGHTIWHEGCPLGCPRVTPATLTHAPPGLAGGALTVQIATTVISLSPATRRMSPRSLVTTVICCPADVDWITAPRCASATETSVR